MTKRIVLLLLGTLFLTAILTPLLCEILLQFSPELPYPFSRLFDRVALVVILGLVFVNRQLFGLQNWRSDVADELGRWPEILQGIALSTSCGVVIVGYYLFQGTVVLDIPSFGYLSRKLLLLLPAALLIATIEESFFRGLLLKQIQRAWGLMVAVTISSAVYSAVHFVAPSKSFVYQQGGFHMGFVYIVNVLARLGAFDLFSSMLGLWLVGVVLCSVVLRRKSLAAAIGLHAGWIVCLKLVTYMTKWGPELVGASTLGKRYFIVGDIPGWICVLAVGALAFKIFPSSETQQEDQARLL